MTVNLLLSWGNDGNGVLGHGDAPNTHKSSPEQVGFEINWDSIRSVAYHAAALKTDGTLWTWGYNTTGELGLEDTNDRSSPEQVGALTDWSYVAGGYYHLSAVKTDGTLWTWGGNNAGQLGLGDEGSGTDRSSPEQVGSLTNWSDASGAVSGGYYSAAAIKTDGTLWSWGRNTEGQLGQEDAADRSSPEQVGTETNWSFLACGRYHTITIKTNGTLWAWGNNEDGQLGLGDEAWRSSPEQVGSLTNWSSVSCGYYHTTALKTDGTLWSWGDNANGMLGLEDIVKRSSPEQVGALTTWSVVDCGRIHTVALKTDGTLWAWGSNNNGSLGLGDTDNRSSPEQVGTSTRWDSVSAGFFYTSGIQQHSEGSVCWGHETDVTTDNTTPMLGNWTGNGTVEKSGDTEKMTLDTPVVQESESWYTGTGKYIVAIDKYRTGTDDKPTISYKTTTSKVECESGTTLWSWGYNGYGDLGQEDQAHRSSPTQIGALTDWVFLDGGGDGNVHGIKTDNTLWSWGRNDYGQLGQEDIAHRSSPVQVGLLTNWKFISGGDSHTIAIKTDGTLWSWGRNQRVQLGLGDEVDRSSPEQIGSLGDWRFVASQSWHSNAIKTDDTLWSWGDDAWGQLGLGDEDNYRSSPEQVGTEYNWSIVAAGNSHTAAIKTDGTLWTWGYDQYGILGQETISLAKSSPEQVGSLTDWSYVNCGDYFTTAIKTDGTLWSWGYNLSGALGLGDNTDRSSPEQVGSLTDWLFTTSGSTAGVMSLKIDGTLWAWGNNGAGQLGQEDVVARSSPVQIGLLTDWSSVSCGGSHGVAIRNGFRNHADTNYAIDSLGWVKIKLEI